MKIQPHINSLSLDMFSSFSFPFFLFSFYNISNASTSIRRSLSICLTACIYTFFTKPFIKSAHLINAFTKGRDLSAKRTNSLAKLSIVCTYLSLNRVSKSVSIANRRISLPFSSLFGVGNTNLLAIKSKYFHQQQIGIAQTSLFSLKNFILGAKTSLKKQGKFLHMERKFVNTPFLSLFEGVRKKYWNKKSYTISKLILFLGLLSVSAQIMFGKLRRFSLYLAPMWRLRCLSMLVLEISFVNIQRKIGYSNYSVWHTRDPTMSVGCNIN